MSARIDYKTRAIEYIGLYKTQKAAATALGIAPRSLRRYREGTRRPRADLKQKMNVRVTRKYRTHNVFIKSQVSFKDKSKKVGYTRVCLDTEALQDELDNSNRMLEEYIAQKKVEEKKDRDKDVISAVKIKALYVKR